VTEPNPSHVLEFRRFSSAQVARWNAWQVAIIRRETRGAAHPPVITHNLMGRETGFDHFELGATCDTVGWDSYPLGFLALQERGLECDGRDGAVPGLANAPGSSPGGSPGTLPAAGLRAHRLRFMRVGDPDFQSFHNDLYRAVAHGVHGDAAFIRKHPSVPPGPWIHELQPAAPVNWAPYNPSPLPGAGRMWIMEAMASGMGVVMMFRFGGLGARWFFEKKKKKEKKLSTSSHSLFFVFSPPQKCAAGAALRTRRSRCTAGSCAAMALRTPRLPR
jgi:beta-galactosidase